MQIFSFGKINSSSIYENQLLLDDIFKVQFIFSFY